MFGCPIWRQFWQKDFFDNVDIWLLIDNASILSASKSKPSAAEEFEGMYGLN